MAVTDSNISPLQQRRRERGRLIVSKKSDCFDRQLCKAAEIYCGIRMRNIISSCQVDLLKFAIMFIIIVVNIIIYDKFPESFQLCSLVSC